MPSSEVFHEHTSSVTEKPLLRPDQADSVIEDLHCLDLEEHPEIHVYNKTGHQPFSVGVFSTHRNITFERFSATRRDIRMAPATISKLINYVNAKSDTSFNVLRLTRFDNGNEFLRFRSEPRQTIGKTSKISHIFFGKQRKMVVRNRKTNKTYSLSLDHGKLITMHGEDFPSNYQYEIPKDPNVVGTSYLCTLYTLPTQKRADRPIKKTT